MRSARPFAIAVSLIALAGCTKPAFTEGVRARFGLSPADIGRVQFYTSRDIVLQREVNDQTKVASGNGIAIRGGVRVEEIDVPAHTPCVAVRVEGDFILCSFSRQHPERALWFGLKKTDQPVSPEAHDYELVQLENPIAEPGPFHPIWSKGFLVTYAGQRYRVVDGLIWSAHLLYDLDESFSKEKVKEEPPGWHLSEGTSAKVAPPSATATVAATASAAPPSAPPIETTDAGPTK